MRGLQLFAERTCEFAQFGIIGERHLRFRGTEASL
jgi:hypothetical protein